MDRPWALAPALEGGEVKQPMSSLVNLQVPLELDAVHLYLGDPSISRLLDWGYWVITFPPFPM